MATLNTTGDASPNSQPQEGPPRLTRLSEGLWRQAGKAVLMAYPKSKEPCSTGSCVLQPFCACAREDFAVDRRLESRVWLALCLCCVLVLLIAFAFALKH